MKNSLALVITENDKNHIRKIYNSNGSILNEQTFTPPAELDTVDKIKAFQVYMNGEDPTWYNGGVLPDNILGQYGEKTNDAWGSHKDAYLARLASENNSQSNNGGNVTKVVDGWYYYKNGAQNGPVKLDELKGVLDDKTYVWNPKLTTSWVKPTDNSVSSQLADIVGPPKFTPPTEPKKTSETDALLKQQQQNNNYNLQQKPNSVIINNTGSNTTTTTTAKLP